MMGATDSYRFWRPTVIIAAAFGVSVALAEWIGLPALHSTATLESLSYPRPELSPADVVRIQLKGLASRNAVGVLQCMCFASPANRAQTGPLERFARMVRRPPYDLLGSADTVTLGSPVYRDDSARVLVTVLRGTEVQSFVWVLTRQADAPYQGCWMADAVLPVVQENRPGPAADKLI